MSDLPDFGGKRIDLGVEADLPEGAEPRVHDARADQPDLELDQSLRPKGLGDFVNQKQVTDQLAVFIEAARRRGNRSITCFWPVRPVWARPRWPTSSPPRWACR